MAVIRGSQDEINQKLADEIGMLSATVAELQLRSEAQSLLIGALLRRIPSVELGDRTTIGADLCGPVLGLVAMPDGPIHYGPAGKAQIIELIQTLCGTKPGKVIDFPQK